MTRRLAFTEVRMGLTFSVQTETLTAENSQPTG